MDITRLSAEQLRRAAQIKDQIEQLNAELLRLDGSAAGPAGAATGHGSRRLSAAGRARIAAAQRARWARQKRKASKAPKKAQRKHSAAAKAKTAAATPN